MKKSVASVIDLYKSKGHLQYDGELVSQIEHAWQCSAIAKGSGASEYLQLAAWLHDFGHLLSKLDGTPTIDGRDDRHEIIGSQFLDDLFPDSVSLPIRLHVDAKRYLVATDPEYRQKLSLDSQRSLELQGGAMTEKQCQEFMAKPYSQDAVLLRHWDDMAKNPNLKIEKLNVVMQSFEELAGICQC